MAMSKDLATIVDEIIAVGFDDPETGHGREDELLWVVVQQYAPAAVWAELARLLEADFPRWCA